MTSTRSTRCKGEPEDEGEYAPSDDEEVQQEGKR